jgi:hypothetical protein
MIIVPGKNSVRETPDPLGFMNALKRIKWQKCELYVSITNGGMWRNIL